MMKIGAQVGFTQRTSVESTKTGLGVLRDVLARTGNAIHMNVHILAHQE